ncbi:Tyrosine-protein kinase RYK [Acropora cervicornis]|uniref:receptor protein-tyrosine kinase n=1 Tax=Acropora cervicornis TaxID=6130 RepID=A0AAD9VH76_ACRCE|nr:Tyrosine-protein kinase RYK [Acropora cervicornis]
MTVPPRVNCLRFVWYSGSKQVPSNAMSYFYSLQMKSDTPDLLLKPKVDIEEGGSVPNMREEFCVNMTCRGTKQGTAHLLIQINITSSEFKFGQNTRVLNLRRIKTCRKGDSESSTSAPLMDKTTVFYIAVGVACSTILVIALAVAAIHVHSMPNPSKESGFVSFFLCLSKASLNSALRKESFVTENLTVYTIDLDAVNPGRSSLAKTPLITVQQSNQDENDAEQNNLIPNNLANNLNVPVDTDIPDIQPSPALNDLNKTVPASNGDFPHVRPRLPGGLPVLESMLSITPSDGYYSGGGLQSTQKGKYRNRDMKAELQDLTVEMDRITLAELLEEGTFARIYSGVLTGPGEKQQQSVLIKTVSGLASTEQVNLLLIESSMLKDFTHRNLLPVMAVCLEDEKQPLVMFPFMNRGNLKLFLKKSRSPEGGSKSLTTADLVHVAIQIAKGLQYLARRRVVHKDVAARNCVIDDDLNVKVTDCALSRDLFPQDYCCLGDNENRPVKWMAVESLEHGRYSLASDGWSYGVLLWELMTLGQQPYGNIDAFEMLNFLKQGHRISQPVNCPDELFTVIACCWALSEDERPSLSQLIVCLTDFLNALSNFV